MEEMELRAAARTLPSPGPLRKVSSSRSAKQRHLRPRRRNG